MEREQKGVDAAETVGAILQGMLQVQRPTRLKELEMATGINAAKLHRYLVSMTKSGLISKQQMGSRYDLGLLTYRLGQAATHGQELLNFLEPYFENFVAKLTNPDLGQAVGIGQWVGNGPTIVKWFESNSPLSIRMKPGVHLSITASATAMLLAAHRPRAMTEPLVRLELEEKNKCTPDEINRVYENFATIHRNGIASSHGSRRAGLNALSVPLFDQSGEPIASITTLGMSPSFDASLKGEAAQLLKKLGSELSSKMGYISKN
jgi:hypothetical protein